MHLVVLGLSLSSSWGNGHATTFRALLAAFAARGHRVTFLERDTPWYRAARDFSTTDYCDLVFYASLVELAERHGALVREADAVMVGSYVPDGVAVGHFVQSQAEGLKTFYDIDTPVTLTRLARGDREYLSPQLIPGYDVYFSFTGGPTLDLIEQRYGARSARPLYCSVDPAAYRPLPMPRRFDCGYLGTYSDDRQPVLDRLLLEPARRCPNLSFVVAGPLYPASIAWPPNVARLEHVPPRDHPAFYAGCRWTLNVTRADMVTAGWSPSVRLFEAAACGTPILSDRWTGLDRLFEPGREIEIVETTDAVVTILTTIEDTPRRVLAQAARRRVLAEHTAAVRAEQLEGHLLAALERRCKR